MKTVFSPPPPDLTCNAPIKTLKQQALHSIQGYPNNECNIKVTCGSVVKGNMTRTYKDYGDPNARNEKNAFNLAALCTKDPTV